ncbi:MAG: cofactor-independent phosphoglycerate mutase [Chloroflexi bacterium]|nr:MAG: cofactor-independent phosphoglycerate mutase [Chloroflexota bacterium]
MKYAILVGDGMADYPLEELGGRTPLEAARTPNMDEIAGLGQLGRAAMIPAGLAPGSDVAMLSILGYDPRAYYTGRGPLEAAKLGIDLGPDEVAFRCNLITVEDGRIADYSAGHISSSEAEELIGFVRQRLGRDGVRFYCGVSYRHICVIGDAGLAGVDCTPPHDVIGEPVERHLPRGDGAERLIQLMEQSHQALQGHPINQARMAQGRHPANMIWLWGQGQSPSLPAFSERFGIGGGVISAVDLIKGLAKLIGLDAIEVPGATGYYDTDYQAKAAYAAKCLDEKAFVLVHVEAADEAGHNGDLGEKISAIERFDQFVVGAIKDRLGQEAAYRIMVLPDHATPLRLRTHTDDWVPFAWCGHGMSTDASGVFSEREAARSSLQVAEGHRLMGMFIGEDRLSR